MDSPEIKRWEPGGNQGRVWDMFQGYVGFFSGGKLATKTCRTRKIQVFRSQGEVRSAQMDVKGAKGYQMDGSWGATSRPPFGFKHHPLEGDLVEGAGIYAFICLEVWKFLHQREGMAASSLEFFLNKSCDPSFWLLGEVAFFLTMRKRHPQGRCP